MWYQIVLSCLWFCKLSAPYHSRHTGATPTPASAALYLQVNLAHLIHCCVICPSNYFSMSHLEPLSKTFPLQSRPHTRVWSQFSDSACTTVFRGGQSKHFLVCSGLKLFLLWIISLALEGRESIWEVFNR